MPPDRGLMDQQLSGVKGNKKRLTYAFTMNADGSEKLVPFVIGKAERPRAFQKKYGAQLGFYYRHNAKAWMTAKLYQEWLRDWDSKLRHQKRHILLLQDNFSAHIVPPGLTNIRVENFKPNLTSHIQPADAGIIRCFKAHYRRLFMNRAIDRYDCDITPALIYTINQLEAMRLADLAWREVDTSTIRHCWKKTGILPDSAFEPTTTTPTIPVSSLINAEDPIDRAERDVSSTLDQLQNIGILQPRNRLNIEELLNLESEQVLLDDASDNEICESVKQMFEAQQMKEINGGDELDNAGDVDKPTWKETLAAISTIQKYVADINEPFARKLESILIGFGRQTRLDEARSLTDTSITDYFTRINA